MNFRTFRHMISHMFSQISGIFLNGLFALLPLTITIAVFRIAFRFIKSWVAPVLNVMPACLKYFPHAELLLVFLFILLIGIILKVFILRSLGHTLEKILFKIPLIRPVYSGIKQLVHAFSPQDTFSFKHVVLIEFPRKGVYSVGFVTSEVPPQLNPEKENTKTFLCVFKPTTPNPTTGFFMFVPEDEVIIVDLTRQEAMALIISGGIIQPDRFAQAKKRTL